jgi:hypothetical protein
MEKSIVTAYEYWEIAHNGWAAAFTATSMMIAVMSGYAVIGYTVGTKLSRIEVIVLNSVYTVIIGYTVASGTLFMIGAVANFEQAMSILGNERPIIPFSGQAYIVIGLVCWVPTIWYLWSVRHPKTE